MSTLSHGRMYLERGTALYHSTPETLLIVINPYFIFILCLIFYSSSITLFRDVLQKPFSLPRMLKIRFRVDMSRLGGCLSVNEMSHWGIPFDMRQQFIFIYIVLSSFVLFSSIFYFTQFRLLVWSHIPLILIFYTSFTFSVVTS